MKNYSLFICLFCLCTALSGQNANSPDNQDKGFVQLNPSLSYLMLEHVQNLRKVDLLIKAKHDGLLENGNLYIGASLITLMDYQHSNTENKFGYLMRHPTASNQLGKNVSEAVIHSVQLSLTSSVNNWLTIHSEFLYDPQQSFGMGTITDLNRNQIQLRKAYILIGDLSKFPVYAAVGKMDAPFGQMGSVSPFTNSTMWHAFGGLGYGAKIGLDKSGINASIMLIQGGPQFRALNVPISESVVNSQLNNFSADINYTLSAIDWLQVQLGVSYVKGTAYCQGFPVVHFMPCEENNPAKTIYGNISYKDRIYLKASFAKTNDEWPGTFNPTPPLNEFEASKVSSTDVGLRIAVNPASQTVFYLSAEFSNFVAGADGAPWERQNQTTLGLSAFVNNTSKFFLEFLKIRGYAPLNFISGGNLDNPGATHSDGDTRNIAFILGGHITI